MFRYRCPHCRQVLQALEIRAGKTTICSKCSKPLMIPADQNEWLTERNESDSTIAKLKSSGSHHTLPGVQPPSGSDGTPFPDFADPIYVGNGRPLPELPSEDIHLPPRQVEEPDPELEATPCQAAVADLPEPPPPAPAPVAVTAIPPEPVVEAIEPAPEPIFEVPPTPTPEPVEPPVVSKTLTPSSSIFPQTRPRSVTESGTTNDLSAKPGSSRSRQPRLPHPTPAPQPAAALDRELSRRRRAAVTRPAPPPPAIVPESLNSTHLISSQLDIAATLTAALTTRMRPPPQPPRDLKPSTALWLLATGVGLALLLLTLVSAGDYILAVAYLGAVEILAGYLWVVGMAFSRDSMRGLVAAVPPFTFGFLTKRKYARFRPLRFVVTGTLLLAGAWAAVYIQPHTRLLAGAVTPPPGPAQRPVADLATQPLLVQLQAYRDQRSFTALSEVLRSLARTDPVRSADARDRQQLSTEIKALYLARDLGVRVDALAAYARWAEDEADARALCLAATRSDSPEERRMALRLLPRWKSSPEVAKSVADLLADPRQTQQAREALLEIGGRAAEEAILPIVRRESEDQITRLQGIEILGLIGGQEAKGELLRLSVSPLADEAIRSSSAKTALIIERRLENK